MAKKKWLLVGDLYRAIGVDILPAKMRGEINRRLGQLRIGKPDPKTLVSGERKLYRTAVQLIEGKDWYKDEDVDRIYYNPAAVEKIAVMLELYVNRAKELKAAVKPSTKRGR